ncbi:leucine-rich repeat neuronal protein 4 [Echeneis naucrates]|uniref:leucine-rich repeat neuronal protein 4 n=1 Tax=Echeneis naucrates TaxID=173247 RepID=UPI0011145D5C|nr:leucine-rich repeat neuronal protein 4-like [Echeneis naucrates]
MPQLRKNLATLLLFLITSPLLHYHLFTHAASTSSPITRQQIKYIKDLGSDDDDDDTEDDYSSPPDVISPVNVPNTKQETNFCEYNPCLENQEPCSEVAARTGCLCPGLSGEDVPPRSPRIQALLPITAGTNKNKVEVQWCAPPSAVTKYKVVVEGHDGDVFEFENALRHGLLGSLEVGTRVCVQAVNNAGQSPPTEFSCQRYDPPSSDQNLLALIIGGGVAFLLLVILIAVILWKQKVCRKGKEDSTDGLGNPSYSTDGYL